MIRRASLLIAVVAMVSPPLDPYLDGSMSGHMLLQMPLLALLGYAAGRLWPGFRIRASSHGVAAVLFGVGSLVFWMLPRSLDTAVTVAWVDQVMHLNMLTAGWFLAVGLPCLPFHTKVAFGVYALAMALAAGVVYVTAVVPVCANYSVQQQNEAGALLLWAGGVVFVILLARSVFLLSRIAATSVTPTQASDHPVRVHGALGADADG